MNTHPRWSWPLIAACLLTTGLVNWSGPAEAQSRSRLRAKKQVLERKIEGTQDKLRNIKAAQRTQKNKLVTAQVELDEAETQLRRATAKLNHTRAVLVEVKRDHKRAKTKHGVQKKRMEARILAQFEAGNPSYLEVVLDSASFADFAERAEITTAIATHDQALVQQLLATRRALATQEVRVKQKEQEQAEARAEVVRDKKTVAVKAEVAEVRLKETNASRAEVERQLAEMEQASAEISSMLARVQRGGVSAGAYSGSWGGSFLRPTPGHISSPFGWRIHPITRTRRFHDGVDLACSGGTTIRAADKGRVIHAGWWGAYGIAVIIDHGSGASTLYGHCMRGSLRVSAGDVVSRGQAIAGVDSTGWSTGNHLHFSVRRYGTPVAPF
jgi:murein DD-endopeptidase MepM/ murein hydrolase activator NlpD